MKDPIEELAGEGLIQMAVDVSLQLEKGAGTRPMLFVLAESRRKAAVALHALTKVDPTESEKIMFLQNEITIYADMIEACQLLFKTAKEQARAIDEADRNAIADLVTDPETARELGVQLPED
jgi:hypothetical protein